MALTDLRALVREIQFSTYAVPATVTRPEPEDTTPIETEVIWLTPFTEESLSGLAQQRKEVRRRMAIRSDDVPVVPRGTVILAAGIQGGSVLRWKVDGIDRVNDEHGRYVVIQSPDRNDIEPYL